MATSTPPSPPTTTTATISASPPLAPQSYTMINPKRPDEHPVVKVSPALSAYEISPSAYLKQHHQEIQHLVAGAVVMHHHHPAAATKNNNHHQQNHHRVRVLLLQRSAHEFLPLRWEVPGGQCEPARDASIVGAACRELREEAGLRAVEVTHVVEDRHDFADDVDGSVWRKMTFLIRVEGDEEAGGLGKEGNGNGDGDSEIVVRLDPNEHEDYVWADEEEVRRDRVGDKVLDWTSPEQKKTVLDAFALVRTKSG
ncbi:hypothetical protein F4778DRAFT_263513 [Xylariomycetidae sp. FL2044]|nr:hypothetical protein F4778DRAFT_263513 [Xylariomycetidae sp. FL2044]